MYNIINMQIKFLVSNLSVNLNNNVLLKNINFTLKTGDVMAVLGPNGAGKSSLLKSLMSHYNYPIQSGEIVLNGKNITDLPTDKKAKLGLFYCSQNPVELDGVQMLEFFKVLSKENSKNFYEFYKNLNSAMLEVKLKHELLKSSVNVGFSGGEKKKNEILQAKLLQPKIMLIDEIDSGLDLDAIKIVADYINKNKKNWITIIVSHHIDFLKNIKPNKSIVLVDGQVAASNQKDIINFVEKNGYSSFFEKKLRPIRTLPIMCCDLKHGKK